MNQDHIRQAVRLFRSPLAPRSVRRYNARAWLKSVHHLGDRWVLNGGAVTWGVRQPIKRAAK